jgi:hypothetical protein
VVDIVPFKVFEIKTDLRLSGGSGRVSEGDVQEE